MSSNGTAFDFDKARFNMIEQQIRPWEVLDAQVLHLLSVVRREDFVPPAYKHLAFVDMEIPLGALEGERMLAPKVEARALQDLALQPTDKVLEIGTGSGYMAALLASLGLLSAMPAGLNRCSCMAWSRLWPVIDSTT